MFESLITACLMMRILSKNFLKALAMNDSWTDNLRLYLLHRIPLFSTFVLIFLFSLSFRSIGFNYFHPMIGLICVYYWCLRSSSIFSYISAFCVGFWLDALSSSPLGLNALLLMILVFALSFLERYLRSAIFGLAWAAFAIAGLAFVLLKWFILVLYFGRLFSFEEILLCYLTTLMFYPLIAWVNVWVQDNFLEQESIDE